MNFSSAISSGSRRLDDWLSPILVKELRQGMRARAFVLSFLLIQVFLVVLVLANLAAEGDRTSLDIQNRFFWIIVGFALLALMPLRGLVTVSLEVKNHTMETVMLTRLTALRVVFGKWSALFAQSLLFVSAVLPYIVLRYFIGGDDVVSDFELLLFFLWLSGMLIAASIAVSALGNGVVRIILIVTAIGVFATGAESFSELDFLHGDPWEVVSRLVIYGFFIPALLFELTATSIAPVSENHAIRRRLLAFLFFCAACGSIWITHEDFRTAIIIPLITLVAICYVEMSEKPRLLPRLVHPLSRRGFLGKIAAFFLLPGWPSALLFTLAVVPPAIALVAWIAPRPASEPGPLLVFVFLTFAVLGSVLPPVLICHFFWKKMNQVLLMVMLYNMLLLGVSSLLQEFAILTRTPIDAVLDFLPGLPIHLNDTFYTQDKLSGAVMGNAVTIALLLMALFLGSRKYYDELFAIFRTGDDLESTPQNPEAGQAPS